MHCIGFMFILFASFLVRALRLLQDGIPHIGISSCMAHGQHMLQNFTSYTVEVNDLICIQFTNGMQYKDLSFELVQIKYAIFTSPGRFLGANVTAIA